MDTEQHVGEGDKVQFSQSMEDILQRQHAAENDSIVAHRQWFAKHYMPGLWWEPYEIALLLAASYQELQPLYIEYQYGDLNGLWDSVFGGGKPALFDEELFEHRLWKKTQDVEAALLSGDLPYEEGNGLARREDAIRWLRKQGVEVDPSVLDVPAESSSDLEIPSSQEYMTRAELNARVNLELGYPASHARTIVTRAIQSDKLECMDGLILRELAENWLKSTHLYRPRSR